MKAGKSKESVRERHKSEFLDHIAGVFRDDDKVDPERVMGAVLKVLARQISSGETESVRRSKSCGHKGGAGVTRQFCCALSAGHEICDQDVPLVGGISTVRLLLDG